MSTRTYHNPIAWLWQVWSEPFEDDYAATPTLVLGDTLSDPDTGREIIFEATGENPYCFIPAEWAAWADEGDTWAYVVSESEGWSDWIPLAYLYYLLEV